MITHPSVEMMSDRMNEYELIRALGASLAHNNSVFEFARHCTKTAHELLDASLTSLWSLDPVNRILVHSTSVGIAASELGTLVLDRSSFSGFVVERKRVQVLRLDEELQHHSFQHRHLIERLGIKWMVSIPVLNIPNHNQVTHVLNMFFTAKPSFDLVFFGALGEFYARKYEEVLHYRCFRISNLLHLDLAKVTAQGILRELCRTLASAVEDKVPADAAAVFIRGDHGTIRLEGLTTHGIRLVNSYGTLCEKLASTAIEANREKISYGVSSFRTSTHPSGDDPCIAAVPVRNLDAQATAAIVLLRRPVFEAYQTHLLTYDDITLAEVMGQSFAPYLELLLSGARRFEALNRLGHEINGPLAGIRATAEVVEYEIAGRVAFGGDYFSDLNGYLDSIVEIVSDFELGVDELSSLSLHTERLSVVRNLFAPTMRAVKRTLQERGFSANKINRPGLSAAPRMWLDRSRMLRVILNLLDNAIKYSHPNPSEFEITVQFATEGRYYAISVRDNGIGVPRGFENRIFSLGIRSPNALKESATGKGLGLPIARNIVRAHGGELVYRRHEKGSEFIILLPKELSERPPSAGIL